MLATVLVGGCVQLQRRYADRLEFFRRSPRIRRCRAVIDANVAVKRAELLAEWLGLVIGVSFFVACFLVAKCEPPPMQQAPAPNLDGGTDAPEQYIVDGDSAAT